MLEDYQWSKTLSQFLLILYFWLQKLPALLFCSLASPFAPLLHLFAHLPHPDPLFFHFISKKVSQSKAFYCLPHRLLQCKSCKNDVFVDACQRGLYLYIDGSVQDCSNSSALAMKLLQSWAKPSISHRNWCVKIGCARSEWLNISGHVPKDFVFEQLL